MIDIEFDNPATWEESLKDHLGALYLERRERLLKPHRYVEDARQTLFGSEARALIIKSTIDWIRKNNFIFYHGTRLIPDDFNSVRTRGLVPLLAADRVNRLERSLSPHPGWPAVKPNLSDAIDSGGKGHKIGNRTGQVHLTLSRAALTNGFNHYLTYGSEFDQHIAYQLLGEEGKYLLASDGDPFVLHVRTPGEEAICGAHRIFSPDEIIAQGGTPNLVSEFLTVLSYREGKPTFDPKMLKVDCGLVLTESIPPERIVAYEPYTADKA